jgi:hypothetical protein
MQDGWGEELPELIQVLRPHRLVWNWEAGAELVRQEPAHAYYAGWELVRGGSLTVLDVACCAGREALSFLEAIRDVSPNQFLTRNGNSELPLDYAFYYSQICVIRMILKIHIEADFETKDGRNMKEHTFNPLIKLCRHYYEEINDALRKTRAGNGPIF